MEEPGDFFSCTSMISEMFIIISILPHICKHTHTHTNTHSLTHTHTPTHTCILTKTHTNTYSLTHTHTRTRRPEVAVNFCSAFHPSRIVPPPGSSRSSGQLLSARGPSEPSVSVRDGQD